MPESVSTSPGRPAGNKLVSRGGKRVLLATWGSFGDLHPYLGLALELKARGHYPVLAAPALYQEKVESEGLEFRPMRPNLDDPDNAAAVMQKAMDARDGSRYVICELVVPHVREQYEDLTAAARGADLMLTHPVTYAAPIVAQKQGLPWVATVLQPMIFVSAYDPPTPPHAPHLARLFRFGPRINGWVIRAVQKQLRKWVEPVDRLRAELGLPLGGNPIFEGQFSPYGNLALFSRALAEPQPDWPARTVVTGFPFYDRLSSGRGMPPELLRFLDAGPPPIVFTLGSSAVVIGGDFYMESAAAARALGRRAVFLVGQGEWNRLPNPLPEGMIACDYAPHGELFPRAAAIVHQGGVGTTGQAMRSGRPMLVVPFSHDQPDHGARMVRRGAGSMILRHRYDARTAERELRKLLEEPSYARNAAAIGEVVRSEDGARTACDKLEEWVLVDRTSPTG